MRVSEAIMLMAGVGSRLVPPASGALKPLTPILQRPLVSYIFDALSKAGIETIHAVVGYESEALIAQLTPIIPSELEIRFIENRNWRKQNGLSVLAAKNQV